MNKLYMGIDIGSISTKGVIIDEFDNIITSSYLWTEGNPIRAVKQVVKDMKKEIDLDNYQVVSIGTTGSARRLIGTLLDACVIKNEIMAQAVGTVKYYPNVKTIFEIGGQDSKIIILNEGMVIDYAINTLCTAGAGAFIDTIAKRLNVPIEEVSVVASTSKTHIDIVSKCSVFAETDLIRKIQNGYKKEDILAGVCRGVAINYINGVAKGKKMQTPIIFNGGVSKNTALVQSLENIIGEKIIVNKNSHLMGAFGVAIMARESKKEKVFDFNIEEYTVETKIASCGRCSNNCEIVAVYKNSNLIDYWGNKCKHGKEIVS